MSVYQPESVSSIGRDGWWFVPTVANKAAMTVAEAGAAGALQINLAFRPGFGATTETTKVADPRHGSTKSYESFGVSTDSLPDIVWIDRPQDANAAVTAKHRDMLPQGTSGYFVNRRGLGSSSENTAAWAAAQRYTLYPVTLGPQTEQAPEEGGGPLTYTQPVIVTGPVVKGTVAA